jgi:predicted NBD/HSP70 family sugar kinase
VLVQHLRRRGRKVADRADLRKAFDGRDEALLEWLADCVDALVFAVRAAVSVLDVPVCVLDSDVEGEFVPELIRRLQAGLNGVELEWRVAPRIVRGSFGPDASALGAASLPMFFNFAPRTDVLRGESAPVREAVQP